MGRILAAAEIRSALRVSGAPNLSKSRNWLRLHIGLVGFGQFQMPSPASHQPCVDQGSGIQTPLTQPVDMPGAPAAALGLPLGLPPCEVGTVVPILEARTKHNLPAVSVESACPHPPASGSQSCVGRGNCLDSICPRTDSGN